MDIISQLQEQVNLIASLAFNTFGTLQRDALPVRLSPNYPDPPISNPNSNPNPNPDSNNPNPQQQKSDDSPKFADEPKTASAALVKAAKHGTTHAQVYYQVGIHQSSVLEAVRMRIQMESYYIIFDALVNALPLAEGGEEVQLKRIAEVQAENDFVGQELQKQLEAAVKELKQVQELFSQASDNCLNMKKPYGR